MNDEKKNRKHKQSMQALKSRVDSSIAAAQTEKGLCVLLSGDGKGKSTSGFGMVMRSLGYGHRVGIVQFIKGEQLSGEEIYLREKYPDMPFYQMGTGFTWDTQDRQADIVAAERTWAYAEELLKNASIDLVLLDELTYMRRPAQQSVVITGRGGGTGLRELADTVSEISSPKHAYESGIKARKGVDF